MGLSKKRKEALSKYDQEKEYNLEEASKIIKEISNTKFDAACGYQRSTGCRST